MRVVSDIIEEKYLDRLPHILGATALLVVSSVMAGLVYHARAARPDTAPVATTPSIVVFETAECDLCEDFRAKIGKPHRSSALSNLVPLRYYDVTDGQPPKSFKLAGGIGASPTTVVFDVYGREVKRVTGVPKTLDDFQSMLRPFVRRAERDLADAQARPGR